MKIRRAVKTEPHAFVTSVLDGNAWPTAGPGHFTIGESSSPLERRMAMLQNWSSSCGEQKIFAPAVSSTQTPAPPPTSRLVSYPTAHKHIIARINHATHITHSTYCYVIRSLVYQRIPNVTTCVHTLEGLFRTFVKSAQSVLWTGVCWTNMPAPMIERKGS
jgi:hypothetical protein